MVYRDLLKTVFQYVVSYVLSDLRKNRYYYYAIFGRNFS